MDRSFSVYLDLVRFTAACLVYMYHSNQRWLVADVLPASKYGHSAVIVFFVLSGFVIAYITDTKERDWVSYGASRIARVFSVVVPAIVICLVLDAVGRTMPGAHYDYPFDRFGLRIIGSLLMLNELWFVSITSFSNVPFWSITYEFWYYVLFGLVMFLPRRVGACTAVLLLCLLGPKLALLAPIWVAGVALYRWRRLQQIPLAWAWPLALGSAAAIVGVHLGGVLDAMNEWFKLSAGDAWHTRLTFSKFFVGDYLLTVLVFLHFVGMRRVAPRLHHLLAPFERTIRWLAGYTFTLYLLHQPLFLFWGAVLNGDPSTIRPWLWVTALVALSTLAVGYATEKRRNTLRLWVQRGLHSLDGRARTALGAKLNA